MSVFRDWEVIPLQGPKERRFFVPRDVLCVSPIFQGWIEDPDTRPEKIIQEDGILRLDCEAEVVNMVISYLQREHDRRNSFEFRLAGHDAVFFVKVYKMALSLGYEPASNPIILHAY